MKLAGRLALVALGVFGVAVAPLELYIIFGPPDGNPIGLGLLFFFGSLLSLGLLAAAALVALVALLRRG